MDTAEWPTGLRGMPLHADALSDQLPRRLSEGMQSPTKHSQYFRVDSLSGNGELHSSSLHEMPSASHSPLQSQMKSVSEHVPFIFTPDPIVNILAAFYSVPTEYHSDLFSDFQVAAEAQSLRQLLDAISDWAATAELYANKRLAQEVQQAIKSR